MAGTETYRVEMEGLSPLLAAMAQLEARVIVNSERFNGKAESIRIAGMRREAAFWNQHEQTVVANAEKSSSKLADVGRAAQQMSRDVDLLGGEASAVALKSVSDFTGILELFGESGSVWAAAMGGAAIAVGALGMAYSNAKEHAKEMAEAVIQREKEQKESIEKTTQAIIAKGKEYSKDEERSLSAGITAREQAIADLDVLIASRKKAFAEASGSDEKNSTRIALEEIQGRKAALESEISLSSIRLAQVKDFVVLQDQLIRDAKEQAHMEAMIREELDGRTQSIARMDARETASFYNKRDHIIELGEIEKQRATMELANDGELLEKKKQNINAATAEKLRLLNEASKKEIALALQTEMDAEQARRAARQKRERDDEDARIAMENNYNAQTRSGLDQIEQAQDAEVLIHRRGTMQIQDILDNSSSHQKRQRQIALIELQNEQAGAAELRASKARQIAILEQNITEDSKDKLMELDDRITRQKIANSNDASEVAIANIHAQEEAERRKASADMMLTGTQTGVSLSTDAMSKSYQALAPYMQDLLTLDRESAAMRIQEMKDARQMIALMVQVAQAALARLAIEAGGLFTMETGKAGSDFALAATRAASSYGMDATAEALMLSGSMHLATATVYGTLAGGAAGGAAGLGLMRGAGGPIPLPKERMPGGERESSTGGGLRDGDVGRPSMGGGGGGVTYVEQNNYAPGALDMRNKERGAAALDQLDEVRRYDSFLSRDN